MGSNPDTAEETINMSFSFGSIIGQNLTWHCCECCNPGLLDCKWDDWPIKSSFITMDEMKLVSWEGPKTNNNKKRPLHVIICILDNEIQSDYTMVLIIIFKSKIWRWYDKFCRSLCVSLLLLINFESKTFWKTSHFFPCLIFVRVNKKIKTNLIWSVSEIKIAFIIYFILF